MTYKTIAGDCWDLIAYKTLGSCKYMDALIDANRNFLRTFIFSAGVELTIPEIEQKKSVINLPAWRR